MERERTDEGQAARQEQAPGFRALCLGTKTFGTEWGWGAEKAESRKIFDVFVKEWLP